MRFIFFIVLFVLISFQGLVYPETKEDLFGQEEAFVKVAEEVGPAVVSVNVAQIYKFGGTNYYYPYRSWDTQLDAFLKEFFEVPSEYRQSGMGSGVIIDPKGYILTNEHVINGADEIEVILSDNRKFKAVLQGSDPRSDLAVIKIEAENLPIAKLGDSDKVRLGQWVLAIGNPFGFIMNNPNPTITVGVVSALHRSFSYTGVDQQRYYGDLIQTDAAINRGNSGGPLVNLKGEVIGINAIIYSTTGGYQGIGFAIPINRAKRILDELISGTEIKYGWVGVQVQSLSDELTALFGFPDKKGALVGEVIENSPAEQAGIKKGDLIRKIDGKEVVSSNDLVDAINHLSVGQKITIVVYRKGKEEDVVVTIGERPKEVIVSGGKGAKNRLQGWRGTEVSDAQNGVVISRLIPGSAGAGSGIQEGDVIDEINRKTVKTVAEFNNITENIKGEVLIHTNRGYFVIKEDPQGN